MRAGGVGRYWPQRSSGSPTTATSATAGCKDSTLSIAADPPRGTFSGDAAVFLAAKARGVMTLAELTESQGLHLIIEHRQVDQTRAAAEVPARTRAAS
jgi:hypothetical protein